MNSSRRILAAVLVLAAAGGAGAIEITDLPQPPASTVSREAVRAEALAANQAKALRYDAAGPAVMPMSMRDREAVRREAAWSRQRDDTAQRDFVGGM